MITNASVSRLGFLYGTFAFALMCFYFCMCYALDLHKNQLVRFGSHVFTVVAVILAIRAFKDQTTGPVSYLSGLRLGFFVGLVGSVIFAAFIFIYASFLHPAYQEDLQHEMYFNAHLSPFVLAGAIALFGTIIGSLAGYILMISNGTPAE
ncbi:DUF4199 domain-containing protein (plasmid) [Hymenobacter sp. NBH84]|uniref:DUF4199 domain-containing protein n=1 Tax=Hymenobacter sp. NBH84 TaxID=2596915 RepID=UPI00162828B6|nr:DUF4199 domain-containing protein [Hymenobacter sp. NBH84]QNE41919.1 DUF4199 domain-containing protein [Hymenobacter sp. NBH84]